MNKSVASVLFGVGLQTTDLLDADAATHGALARSLRLSTKDATTLAVECREQ